MVGASGKRGPPGRPLPSHPGLNFRPIFHRSCGTAQYPVSASPTDQSMLDNSLRRFRMNFNSPTLHFLFLSLFILAFFPSLFNVLVNLPISLLRATGIARSPPSACSIGSCSDCAAPPSQQRQQVEKAMASTSWFQKTISLPAKSRGSYLVTDQVVQQLPELRDYKVGLLNLFMQHTSAALTLNENWDSDVREDMSDAMDRIVPEDRKGNLYRHSAEGLDDMPAHVKTALVGASITIPITNGRLNTGTWQGIWYMEFRAAKHSRKVVATIQGEKA